MAVQTQSASSAHEGDRKPDERLDMKVLWGGVLFSLVFTAIIWLLRAPLEALHPTFLPDAGFHWYWWKLPERTLVAQITAWGFYLAHQFAIWGIIFYAQKRKERKEVRYTTGLHNFNYWALGINAFFVVLHLVQTHVWYDALAMDLSPVTSQASVVIMLVMILMMETPRRGLIFGYRTPLPKRALDFTKKYHGYIFSWAIIFTFWYHPMEASSGHLLGFFYTFLLMIQGSLFLTRAHLNRWWTFSLEFAVLVHGTMVAVMQANNIWPMFFFGFAGILVLTQIHGLGLSRRTRALIIATYIGSALWIYNGRGFDKLDELIRIPIIEYLAVYVIAILLAVIIWVVQRVGSMRQTTSEQVT